MTFSEITQRRLVLDSQLDRPLRISIEPPEWQQVNYENAVLTYTDEAGIVHQRCGGGCRIVRKRIGGG
jgi:hypothetical protein